MDERFRGKKHWFGLGAVAIIFMCLMLCGLTTFAMLVTRSGTVHIQPAAGAEGVAPPQVYRAHGPVGILGTGVGLLFTMLFFGLILILLFGLARRFFWGPRYWHPSHTGKPPKGGAWSGKPHAWGPGAWHGHGRYWGPHPDQESEAETGDKGEADTEDVVYDGPQE